MAPIILSANQPPARFYQGGKQIADFRSQNSYQDHEPEDWIGSTTCCFGQKTLGLSKLPDGTWLVDEVKKNPIKWLGSKHAEKFGADTKILVKLLDAGQRLPVHAHPHVKWAKAHVGAVHGKAEAWYMLNAGEVHLGLKETISIPDLLPLVKEQKVDTLLGMMHKIPVQARQTIYIPPGLLHAIGEGIMLVEVQEPEDLSILLEWQGFDIDGAKDGHMGLGFEKALTGVETKERTLEEVQSLISPPNKVGSVIVPSSEEYFRLEHLKIEHETKCERGFAVIIVLEGNITVKTSSDEVTEMKRGDTAVVAHEDGDLLVQGVGDVVFARPPAIEK